MNGAWKYFAKEAARLARLRKQLAQLHAIRSQKTSDAVPEFPGVCRHGQASCADEFRRTLYSEAGDCESSEARPAEPGGSFERL